MLRLGPHIPIDTVVTTSASTSDCIPWSKPEKPKGKKARIRELERRIAELEAIVAKMPTITYTSPGWPQWHTPVVTC